MAYLYHRVPKDMEGDILYPLNTLKYKHPHLYSRKKDKYIGREHLMEEKIPPLNCLWNDVLHFTAVNPQDIKKALIEVGEKDFKWKFYQIDPRLLESKNTIVYLYEDNVLNKANKEDFAEYNLNDIEKYSHMNQDTKNYYKEIIAKGEQPLIFHRIPHILYKGSIDVSNVKIITV